MIKRVFILLCGLALLPIGITANPHKEEIVAFCLILQKLNLSLNGNDICMVANPSWDIIQRYEDRLAQMQKCINVFREQTYPHIYLTCAIIGQQTVLTHMKRELSE